MVGGEGEHGCAGLADKGATVGLVGGVDPLCGTLFTSGVLGLLLGRKPFEPSYLALLVNVLFILLAMIFVR